MLWLQTPPWGRWMTALVMVSIALWVELRPDATVEHPFAVEDIAIGDELDSSNTELRQVPTGLLDRVDLGSIVVRPITAGSPVLDEDLREPHSAIPSGWWIVAAEVPPSASPGDAVRVVLLDERSSVEGFVASVAVEDAFGTGLGSVAVPSESAAEVASAQANGRVAVLVSTG